MLFAFILVHLAKRGIIGVDGRFGFGVCAMSELMYELYILEVVLRS